MQLMVLRKPAFLLNVVILKTRKNKTRGMFTPSWNKCPEITWNTNIWMWSWYLFAVYFHNVLIKENNTYSYIEHNFLEHSEVCVGLENTDRFLLISLAFGSGKVSQIECLTGVTTPLPSGWKSRKTIALAVPFWKEVTNRTSADKWMQR